MTKESTTTIIRMEMGTPKSPMTLRSCGQRKEPVVSVECLLPTFLPILHLPGSRLNPRGPPGTEDCLYSNHPVFLLPLLLAVLP